MNKIAENRAGSPFRGHMRTALDEAGKACRRGEIPVGAAITDAEGRLVAAAGNRVRELKDPTAHAEILAIRAACRFAKSERLNGFSLFVTLEPCPMCAAAIAQARIARLYYGPSDPKSGGVESGPRVFEQPQCHHCPEVYSGIAEAEAAQLLVRFFASLRSNR